MDAVSFAERSFARFQTICQPIVNDAGTPPAVAANGSHVAPPSVDLNNPSPR